MKRCWVVVAVLLCVLSLPLSAQTNDSTMLTLDRIFGSGEFYGRGFAPGRWYHGGSEYESLEPSKGHTRGRDLVRYETESGRREIVVPAERFIPAGDSLPLSLQSYEWSKDGKKLLLFTNTRRVWRQNTRGDYWVLDLLTWKLKKLGGDAPPSTLMFAKFSPDDRKVGYVRGNNLYVQNLNDFAIIALTGDGSETLINGTSDWVYEEEFDVRDGFRWSPDSKWIAYWQFNSEEIPVYYLIDDTDSLYPFLKPVRYPVAGQPNSACRIGVVSASGGATRWMDVPGDPADTYIPRMEWAESSDELILQHMNRLQNNNDLMLADARSGRTRTILEERDSTWVEVVNTLHWLDGGKKFLWESERDGWNHLYVVSRSGGDVKPITPGAFDVTNVDCVDEKGGWLYYTASPENPTQRYLYRVRLNGEGKAESLSPAGRPGWNSYTISPDGRWAFHTFSTINDPSATELIRIPDHSVVRVLNDNARLRAKVNALKRTPTEFMRLDVGGGVVLDAYCMKPYNFDPSKRYPVFFDVYGEPAGQTVADRWGGSLWSTFLTQKGYIVMSVDNRGTAAPRGHAWRRSIYKKIGIVASADQAAAARIIGRWPFVDSTRIGIWGWSGGGSMSLNMIFRYPEIYSTAIAVASVPDLRYYDSIYQERYMGLPQDDPEAYKLCSPITYADRLRGHLLIVHGSGDDNVHYKGAEALINALVAANKQFSMMEYPNRSHGIFEGMNTTRHLYELMTSFLESNLPPGPANP